MEETKKHTPGPWRIEADVPGDQDIAIVAGDPRIEVYEWAFVAHVCGPEIPEDITEPGGFDRAEALANAHLIAAAPALLEALRGLLSEVERERDYEHWQGVIDPARAALALAEPSK